VDQGALILISHPVKLHGALPPQVDSWAEGVEVWNTRYDGRRRPRPKNLQLYHDRRIHNASTIAIGGTDFHSVSDLSDLRLEVSLPAFSVDALIGAIRAGDFRIMNGNHPVDVSAPIDASLDLKRQASFFDLAVQLNRRMKAIGIIVPKPLRNAVKKWI
jgi:hypothetical protein